jgi:hypothetical protein
VWRVGGPDRCTPRSSCSVSSSTHDLEKYMGRPERSGDAEGESRKRGSTLVSTSPSSSPTPSALPASSPGRGHRYWVGRWTRPPSARLGAAPPTTPTYLRVQERTGYNRACLEVTARVDPWPSRWAVRSCSSVGTRALALLSKAAMTSSFRGTGRKDRSALQCAATLRGSDNAQIAGVAAVGCHSDPSNGRSGTERSELRTGE